jgi:plasmid maintenance system antidote protein VapI
MNYPNEEINAGGINGIGNNPIDISAEEFLILRQKISEDSRRQTRKQKIETIILATKLRMVAYLEQYTPETIISAGAFLKALLDELNIPGKRFASYIGLQPSNLSALLSGKRKMKSPLALTMEEIFDIDAEIWLKIEARNEIHAVRGEVREEAGKYRLGDLID